MSSANGRPANRKLPADPVSRPLGQDVQRGLGAHGRRQKLRLRAALCFLEHRAFRVVRGGGRLRSRLGGRRRLHRCRHSVQSRTREDIFTLQQDSGQGQRNRHSLRHRHQQIAAK